MFTLETRMSDALAERPALREILPAFHPAFAKLTHPWFGKILPRLVTVADAARVAGCDAQTLLDVMNLPGPPAADGAPQPAAAGEPVPLRAMSVDTSNVLPVLPVSPVSPGVSPASSDASAPGWLRDPRVLDVRPALAEGHEPFAVIMAALRVLAPGQPLTVLAPFEPAPLLRLLEARGWTTHVAWDAASAPACCGASFWRAPAAEEIARPVAVALTRGADGARVDVRGLEPPEPLRRVLAALDQPDALPLVVVHDREPALLYPRLVERGLRWTVTPTADHVEIRIDREPPR